VTRCDENLHVLELAHPDEGGYIGCRKELQGWAKR